MDVTTPPAAVGEGLAAAEPRRFALPNGVELHGVIGGEGPPLVFIHGAMGDWRSFEPQWAAFTPHFTCLTYSRRYSFPNRNGPPGPDHSALHEAEDLRLLLDALGWSSAVLVGSSYGGFTALALAVAEPARVRALVAVEPPMMKYAALSAAGRAAAADFCTRVIEPANAAFRAGRDEEGARLMTGGINGAASPLNDGEALARRLQNLGAMKALALSSDEFPWLAPEQLAALSMPLLLLSGARTPAVHAEIFRNVCAAMPQAKALVMPDAGHGVARDAAAAFNTTVLDFLRAHSTREETP
ncbi:alpha/beta fold hydrolase [Ramlibacter sp.]|uniref:alpha/beta fold hydrolase n=1 Tax=Ramlibacter sp. TaxID=1917967 RepID=UPI0035AF37A2